MQENKKKVAMVTINDAIKDKLISNETIGYFLAKIHMFAKIIGLVEHKIRFRQHFSHEMAHYSTECWDLETYVNDDWLECVGCANRGSYDLQAHSFNKNNELIARRVLDKPILNRKLKIEINKKIVGKRYKELTRDIVQYFENMNQKDLVELRDEVFKDKDSMYIHIEDFMCVITKDMVRIQELIEKVEYEEYYPHTIESSFGIDRLLYSVFEHNFWERVEDSGRIVLSLPYTITPYNIAIFSLHNKKPMVDILEKINLMFKKNGYRCYLDNSNTVIGKRYARLDEIGVRYAITVDPGTLGDNKVTIRDRDSMKQMRVSIEALIETIKKLENVGFN
jgi:glycyl-tRNA synthetase